MLPGSPGRRGLLTQRDVEGDGTLNPQLGELKIGRCTKYGETEIT